MDEAVSERTNPWRVSWALEQPKIEIVSVLKWVYLYSTLEKRTLSNLEEQGKEARGKGRDPIL